MSVLRYFDRGRRLVLPMIVLALSSAAVHAGDSLDATGADAVGPEAVANDPRLWNWDAATDVLTLEPTDPVKHLALPRPSARPSNFSSRTVNDDGSTAMTVGRNLPIAWDSKIGVDVATPATPHLATALPVDPRPTPTGAAWASVALPDLGGPLGWDKASVNARVNPLDEQTSLGTSWSRSVPLGDSFAVTVHNGYAVTQPTAPNAAAPSWSTDRTLKFSILPSQTTFSAGEIFSSHEDKWLRSFGAEQKLFGGPVSVAGTASETAAGDIAKSLTARFTHSW